MNVGKRIQKRDDEFTLNFLCNHNNFLYKQNTDRRQFFRLFIRTRFGLLQASRLLIEAVRIVDRNEINPIFTLINFIIFRNRLETNNNYQILSIIYCVHAFFHWLELRKLIKFQKVIF